MYHLIVQSEHVDDPHIWMTMYNDVNTWKAILSQNNVQISHTVVDSLLHNCTLRVFELLKQISPHFIDVVSLYNLIINDPSTFNIGVCITIFLTCSFLLITIVYCTILLQYSTRSYNTIHN